MTIVRPILIALSVLALAACQSDSDVCDLLVARCPADGNRAACRDMIRALRDAQGGSAVARARACLREARTCDAAAKCIPSVQSKGSGWTEYTPYAK